MTIKIWFTPRLIKICKYASVKEGKKFVLLPCPFMTAQSTAVGNHTTRVLLRALTAQFWRIASVSTFRKFDVRCRLKKTLDRCTMNSILSYLILCLNHDELTRPELIQSTPGEGLMVIIDWTLASQIKHCFNLFILMIPFNIIRTPGTTTRVRQRSYWYWPTYFYPRHCRINFNLN